MTTKDSYRGRGSLDCDECVDLKKPPPSDQKTLVVGSLAVGTLPTNLGLVTSVPKIAADYRHPKKKVVFLRSDRGSHYTFSVSPRGRVEEFTSPSLGYRVVARVADESLVATISAIDKEILKKKIVLSSTYGKFGEAPVKDSSKTVASKWATKHFREKFGAGLKKTAKKVTNTAPT